MHWHRIKRLPRLLFCAALGIGFVADAAENYRAVPDAAPIPSADAFDTLFKRLDLGDLSELDTPRQLTVLAQLEQLLPRGDLHRQRLLDSERCGLNFVNAIKDGFAFADSKLAEALAANDNAAAIRFYYCRSGYQSSLSTSRDALGDINRGIDLARQINDEPMLAFGLELRGGIYSYLGIYGKALADLLEAQRTFVRNELPEQAGMTLQDIGAAYRRLGYADKAREYLNQSIEHEQRVGDHESLFSSTLQLGFVDEETGHYAEALVTQQKALELAIATGDHQNIGSANLALAAVFTDLQRYPDAQTALQKAEADFAIAGDNSNAGMVAYERGRALAGLGQQRKALDEFSRAETAFDASGNTRYQEQLHQAKAQTLETSGQATTALTEYKRYLALHEEVGRQRADQQAQMLREQFDTDRSNMENARLKAEQALTDHQVEALQRVRAWQQTAMGLLAILLGLFALLVIRQLRKLRSWKRMASIDALTGVSNRRGVEQFMAAVMRQARMRQEALAVLALDIDHFKHINDSFGHAAGDRVLQHVARTCGEALRDGDLLGRIGGEEFLVVLPGNTLEQAAADVAERLRSRVEALALDDLPAGLRTTISIGVAQMSPQDANVADLLLRADEALYRAKAEGRNRVVGAPEVSANQELGAVAGTAATTGGGAAS
jgi:diguanylate cyclase (GGDEF)-like protein